MHSNLRGTEVEDLTNGLQLNGNLKGVELRSCYLNLKNYAEQAEGEKKQELLKFASQIYFGASEERWKLKVYYDSMRKVIKWFKMVCTAKKHVEIINAGGWPTDNCEYYGFISNSNNPYVVLKRLQEELNGHFITYRRHAKWLGIETTISKDALIELLLSDDGRTLAQVNDAVMCQKRTEWPDYVSFDTMINR